MTRAPRLALAGLLLTLGLAACGSPVQAGAAALVGDTRLDGTTFTDEVRDALAEPTIAAGITADVPTFQRSVLTEYVGLQLLQRAAAQNGVAVDRGDVDDALQTAAATNGGPDGLRARAAQAGYSEARLQDLARSTALSQALGEKLTAGQLSEDDLRTAYQAQIEAFQQVGVAEVLLASQAEAEALLPQAQAGSDEDFAELARTRSLDTQLGPAGGDTGLQSRSAFQQAGQTDVAARAFAAQVGDVFVVPDPAGALLVRVLVKQTTSFQQARPQLEAALAGPAQDTAVSQALAAAAQDVEIRINPRYGRWDQASLNVVAGDDQLSRPAGATPAPSDDPAGQLIQPPS